MLRRLIHWAIYPLIWHSALSVTEPKWPSAANAEVLVGSSQQTRIGHSNVESDVPTAKVHPRHDALESLDQLVRRVPICIVGSKPWYGELGASILYRTRRIAPDRVRVGYFVYFTTERPFGNNLQTRSVLPAIAIDAFYSHLLFVLPGMQRVIYGAGDVEGVSVTYRMDENGRLLPVEIVADDAAHALVSLDVRDAVQADGRIVLLDEVWSHQLGGRRANEALRQGADCRCYENDALRPLSLEVAAQFRLGDATNPRRAGPAWQ